MIVYMDASALVKRYVAEAGSGEVDTLIAEASVVGTAVISHAEAASALAKAVRMRLLSREEAASALQVFNAEWESLVRLQLTEVLLSRAATLAWDHGLRGYDAVHLAAALFWQEMLGDPISLATYDRQLWEAAQATGLSAWPEALP
ncbi:MAG: type II toxin-antitoxin system VapC family toxin [Alphaproteobacteria bacterium]|uniref:Type II toxin-antitoxin system VapC family toxin n=1 Tax=Candidatus Nitrobium versatile TaxID=2884831 RepID=A0A953M2R5_9BACT|nr:type II toxin-antitoxin system VapC family toxin [Candidatus Nitrobium versatile]